MKQITLYRTDFRDSLDTGKSPFDDIIEHLGLDNIPDTSIEDFIEITIDVDFFIAGAKGDNI